MFKKIVQNIPNTITFLRGALGITLLPALFFSGNILGSFITYIALGATDFIDGSLARVLKTESKFGEKIDPISDKALGITSLALVSIINPLMYLPLVLESLIGIVGCFRYRKEKDEASVIKIGKFKMTSLFMTTILTFLSALNPAFLPFQIGFLTLTSLLQGVTLYENIKKVNEKEVLTPIIKPKEEIEEEKIENQDQKSIKKTLTVKDKYIKFRDLLDDLVSSKEDRERELGSKVYKKHFKR